MSTEKNLSKQVSKNIFKAQISTKVTTCRRRGGKGFEVMRTEDRGGFEKRGRGMGEGEGYLPRKSVRRVFVLKNCEADV